MQPIPAEPEPYSSPAATAAALPSRDVADAAPKPYRSSADSTSGFETAGSIRFQRRLVAALIVVTAIIALLLFFLVRTGRAQFHSRQRSWTERLPETKDPAIETIDSTIRNHLKTYARL